MYRRVLALAATIVLIGCENMPDRPGEALWGLSKCAGGSIGDLDFCDASCLCDQAEGHCQNDGECSAGLVCGPFNGTRFGLPWNYQLCWPPHCRNGVVDEDETAVDCGGSCGVCYCPFPDGHYAHCNSTSCPCPSGEGDCDSDAECQTGLICAFGTGPRFGWPTTTDMCLPPHCIDGVLNGDETELDCGGSCGACVCPGVSGDPNFCTPSCPCGPGQGDCDGPQDCIAGLECVSGRGPEYGLPTGTDVCIAAHCTNRIQDGDETGIDCGGSCGNSCPPEDATNQNVDSAGVLGDDRAFHFLGVSAGGRYVAFVSEATNLVPNDNNGVADVFVRDNVLGTTQRVSVAANGAEANGRSVFASISEDGRFVAFSSLASNLVPGDTNGVYDVFIKDRVVGTIWRMSRSSAGQQGNADALFPQISGNGAVVAYTSGATNLVDGDTNGVDDIFVSVRSTGQTIRASQSTAGVQTDGACQRSWLDFSGTFIVFACSGATLVAGDTNNAFDVFLHHRAFRTTTRLSVASDGTQGNNSSINPRISRDANIVVFSSAASNLTAGDTNGRYDVFVRDRAAGTTERVSVATDGTQSDQNTAYGHPSGDGRYIVMASGATTLVPGDTNATGDIFVRDRSAGTTVRVEGSAGQPNGLSDFPILDPSGAYIAFTSDATNLTLAPDDNMVRDVFLIARP